MIDFTTLGRYTFRKLIVIKSIKLVYLHQETPVIKIDF